ncbi:hypothetical protein EZV62_019533 [Acer yangbiense]|uniref:Uncharacterized protein n=1 Tax=Acer yangbiense TaxID=1000413 RepID=A0A5C7HBH9_9ROSI|nr:hypothetical protein EZV62_019533 [Acer yangbiense]
MELQSMRVSRIPNTNNIETNTFALGEPSHQPVSTNISCAIESKVSTGGKALVPIDLSIPIPVRTYARVTSNVDFEVKVGDKIA